MPKALDDATKKEGWTEVPKEEVGKYAGDVIITAKAKMPHNLNSKTAMWQNLEAVQNKYAFNVDSSVYWYNDPYTLDVIRKDLKKQLLALPTN